MANNCIIVTKKTQNCLSTYNNPLENSTYSSICLCVDITQDTVQYFSIVAGNSLSLKLIFISFMISQGYFLMSTVVFCVITFIY